MSIVYRLLGPYAQVNDVSGPFWGKGAWPPSQILSLCVCNMLVVSTVEHLVEQMVSHDMGQTRGHNSFYPRGTRVNGVACGGETSYSCILGAFGPGGQEGHGSHIP